MSRNLLLPTVLLFILIGCAAKIRKPLLICPGKSSVAEAIVALQLQSQNMTPLYVRGKCRLQYYDDSKKHKEDLTVRILVKPPVEIYLRGDMSVLSKAVVLGSNEREFWLAVKPNEISTYWWGQWSELDSSETLLINPKTLLEALGITKVDIGADWSLVNQGPFDILTKRKNGIVIKRIHVYCCDYTIRKIEYFDMDGRALAYAELDEYQQISESFLIPSLINITTLGQSKEDTVSINFDLGSIKTREITEKQSDFFKPVPRQGFKHVLQLVNGRWIEQ